MCCLIYLLFRTLLELFKGQLTKPSNTYFVSDVDVSACLKKRLHHGEMTFIGSPHESRVAALFRMGRREIKRFVVLKLCFSPFKCSIEHLRCRGC